MKLSPILRGLTMVRPNGVALATACAFALAAAQGAAAGACGDKIGGERIPCACGDEVVSDTVLWPTDPVVSEPCSGDGLVVLAPVDSDGITLNLGGQSMLGTGTGAGIRVARGGRLGSVILGGDAEDTRAEIARFGTGIRASGRNILREVRAIDVHDNRDDGLKIRTSGVRVEDVRSQGNGRNGVALSGHGNEVSGVVSDNNIRDGLELRGSGATVSAETSGNGRNGTAIGGRGNTLTAVQSSNNGGAGVHATGVGHELAELQSSDNAGGDVAGRAGATK